MNAKTVEKLEKRVLSEIKSAAFELQNALNQITYHSQRFTEATSLSDKADALDAINRNIRQMKSHINETAFAYIAGQFDAAED